MFFGLTIEMAKTDMETSDLAKALGINPKAAKKKLKGKSDFTMTEMVKIKKIFPEKTLDYLFWEIQ